MRHCDQKKVICLLDRLETMDEGARVTNDQILMMLVSACGPFAAVGFTGRIDDPKQGD